MTREDVAVVMSTLFKECEEARVAGQKEYAHDRDNAFRNFEAIGNYLAIDRRKVLLTYAIKHLDGIVAHVNGHLSQREPVRGRIKDLIVYLVLLTAMEEESASILFK